MFSNRKKLKIQGKNKAHKKALVKSQVIELVRNYRIKTTPKKARVLKSSFDRLVTHSKKGTDSAKREVHSFFAGNERAIERFESVVTQYLGDRNSGYTRLAKTLSRPGDNADQVYVMIVNTELKKSKSKVKKAVEKKEKKEEQQAQSTITGRVKKAVSKVSAQQPKVVSKEKTAKTRRNSK